MGFINLRGTILYQRSSAASFGFFSNGSEVALGGKKPKTPKPQNLSIPRTSAEWIASCKIL